MTSEREKYVVDTNVPVTANKFPNSEGIPDLCILTCIEFIEGIISKGGIVLDSDGEIYSEYLRHLSLTGEPGVGDKFILWLTENQWKSEYADIVKIPKNGNFYSEFPGDILRNFDPSDEKFVAAAIAHPQNPTILQATDSKWWGWKDDLESVGINVKFICPDYIREKYRKKFPNKGKQEKES